MNIGRFGAGGGKYYTESGLNDVTYFAGWMVVVFVRVPWALCHPAGQPSGHLEHWHTSSDNCGLDWTKVVLLIDLIFVLMIISHAIDE